MTPANVASGLTLDVVTFRVGTVRCAVEARRISASRPLSGTEQPAPTPLAAILKLADCDPTARQALHVKHPEGERPYAVTPPVQLEALPIESIHPLPPLLAARTTIPGLRALILDAQGITLLVDVASD